MTHTWRCTAAGGCFGDLGVGQAMQATLVRHDGRFATAKTLLEEQRARLSQQEQRRILSRTVEALAAAAGRPPPPPPPPPAACAALC